MNSSGKNCNGASSVRAASVRGASVSCVVVAAGKASRMGGGINKQFTEIAGIPVIARTLMAFEKCPSVNNIIVVINNSDRQKCESLVKDYGISKIGGIAEGGPTRRQSVYNGLRAITDHCRIVLIHDGARPFVDRETIENCIRAADEFGACCAAVPVKDTIKVVDSEYYALKTPDRKELWAVQTPQAFDYRLILGAHQKALEDGFDGTDDAMLVERMGVKVKMVMSSYFNIKITTNEDLVFAEAIARSLRI
jgi:2-C-methyl-D-erythritol 4-phosphate cytidylyltransferase